MPGRLLARGSRASCAARSEPGRPGAGPPRSPFAVLAQSVRAGLFQSQGYAERWVRFHDIGGEITLTPAVLSLIAAVISLRQRTALLIGTVVLTLLVALEWFLGDQMGGVSAPAWFQAVHVPLAMVLLALAVYLPVLHGRGSRTGR